MSFRRYAGKRRIWTRDSRSKTMGIGSGKPTFATGIDGANAILLDCENPIAVILENTETRSFLEQSNSRATLLMRVPQFLNTQRKL